MNNAQKVSELRTCKELCSFESEQTSPQTRTPMSALFLGYLSNPFHACKYPVST